MVWLDALRIVCACICFSYNCCDIIYCYLYIIFTSCIVICVLLFVSIIVMGWLRWVGCLKIQVSLQNTGLFCRALLQKRPIFLSILLIVATPYLWKWRDWMHCASCVYVMYILFEHITYCCLYLFLYHLFVCYLYIIYCHLWEWRHWIRCISYTHYVYTTCA